MSTQEQPNPDVDTSHSDLGARPAEHDKDLKRVIARLKEQLADQKQRIESLARGREEGMTLIGELRAELALLTAERDELRSQLAASERRQTATLLHEPSRNDATDSPRGQPQSIDELMATFGHEERALPSHSTSKVDSGRSGESGAYEEMISPDLIVLGSSHELSRAHGARYLVWVGSGNNRKFALDADLLTIGRSESADIPIDADAISRIHARILRVGMDCLIEDAGSRNGTWVNGEKIDRHVLKHGDVIRIGSGTLRYIDAAARSPSK